MGPSDDRPGQRQRQGRSGRAARPRARMCLLKGCGESFQPSHPQRRYCGYACRAAAKSWRDWKSRQRYRGTERGREKRRGQSRRYRGRMMERKRNGEMPRRVPGRGARVSVQQEIFVLVRPARLLRDVRSNPALALAAILHAALSEGAVSRAGAGAAMAAARTRNRARGDSVLARLSVTYCRPATRCLI